MSSYVKYLFMCSVQYLTHLKHWAVFLLLNFKTSEYIFWMCCCLVAKSCPTLLDPMDCSMPGPPVPHHLPEFAQVYVHWIGDAIQPSHPLSPSSAFSLSLHQGLFQWVGSLYQLAKVLELQHQIKVLHPKCASQIFSQSMVAFLHAVFQKECLHLINSNLFIFSFMSLILLF